MFTPRLARWSVRDISDSNSLDFSVFQNLEKTWGISFKRFGLWSYAYFGSDLIAAYPSSAAALRALKRIRPDVVPVVRPRHENISNV